MSTGKPRTVRRSLIPTIGCAIGMLTGGMLGTGVGSLFGNELALVTLYAGGAVMGAIGGSRLGIQWKIARQQPQLPPDPAPLP